MKLNDFFHKLFKLTDSMADQEYNAIVDNRDYAVFRALEAQVGQEIHEYFKTNSPRFYAENKPEIRRMAKVILGAVILTLGNSKANEMMRSSEIARTMNKDSLIYEEARKILLQQIAPVI